MLTYTSVLYQDELGWTTVQFFKIIYPPDTEELRSNRYLTNLPNACAHTHTYAIVHTHQLGGEEVTSHCGYYCKYQQQ
jgi:hypothetical protein